MVFNSNLNYKCNLFRLYEYNQENINNMNRVIKFRAWDNLNNKWLHGYKEGGEGCNILGETILLGGWMSQVSIKNLNDVIVSQFTGLKDKNNKDIYDGDIVFFKANYTSKPCGYKTGIIKITPYKLILTVGEIEYDACEETEEFPYARCEIIGNIYSSPELLQSKNS